jgi:hypothetical protein
MKPAPNSFGSANHSQKGAALVTTLLIAALLLTAGGALILATTMTGTNTFDSAAEAQAYYGAEAGLQATLNVLRGNTTPLQGTYEMSLANAVDPKVSNLDSDTSAVPRLSRWIAYSNSYPDRVPINANYTPFNGIAYKIEVINPDASGLSRLLIRSTGIGPRGSVKVLTMMLTPRLNEIKPPGLITIRGSDNPKQTTHFKFSGKKTDVYSGVDLSNPTAPPLPIFALLEGEIDNANKKINKKPPTFESDPVIDELDEDNIPSALSSATAMIAFLNKMQALAKTKGRYFTKDTLSGPAVGLTYLDAKGGTVVVDGGSGVLIVTGDLKIKKSSTFSGLIIVAGGTLDRDDAGNITGAVVLADVNPKKPGKGFRKPHFHAGDNQRLQYDSAVLGQAMTLGGFEVVGVSEK